MIQYHNTDVWTFLKLVIIIEHMKMMQMPYLTYGQCFFLGKCLHRTNSSQLFRNGLFQKKKPNQTGGRERRVEAILFFLEKPLELFWFFSVSLKISGKRKLNPWKFGKIMYLCYIPQKFQKAKTHNPFSRPKTFTWIFLGFPWIFHVVFN